MKRLLLPGLLSLGLFTACDTAKLTTSVVDDTYAVPSEELAKARAEAVAKEKQLAEERAAMRAKYGNNYHVTNENDSAEANNPYYKDPQYSADDYYDYAYSARINRFHNPIGVGYYDNYYTNMYSYSQNPMLYGTSIYSGYGYGMPSTYFGYGAGMCYGSSYYYDPFFNNYSWGWNSCGNMGYGYNYGYNSYYGYGYPYYSSWSYNPYYNSYWAGYNNGYNNGYWNGWNSGRWTYLNSFDNNSGYQNMTNAPREVHSGGMRNSLGQERTDNAGTRSYYEQVAEQQNSRRRFDAPRENAVRNNDRIDGSSQRGTGGSSNGTIVNGGSYNNGGSSTRGSETRSSGRSEGRVYSSDRVDRSQGTQQSRSSNSQQNNSTWSQPSQTRSSGGGNSGGGSAPRSSGGGGGGRSR